MKEAHESIPKGIKLGTMDISQQIRFHKKNLPTQRT